MSSPLAAVALVYNETNVMLDIDSSVNSGRFMHDVVTPLGGGYPTVAVVVNDGAPNVQGMLTITTQGSTGNVIVQFDFGSGTTKFIGSGAITGHRYRIEGPTVSGSTLTGKIFIREINEQVHS